VPCDWRKAIEVGPDPRIVVEKHSVDLCLGGECLVLVLGVECLVLVLGVECLVLVLDVSVWCECLV